MQLEHPVYERYRDKYDKYFMDEEGILYTFLGIIDSSEDLYYVMREVYWPNSCKYLSCVGDVKSYGFKELKK